MYLLSIFSFLFFIIVFMYLSMSTYWWLDIPAIKHQLVGESIQVLTINQSGSSLIRPSTAKLNLLNLRGKYLHRKKMICTRAKTQWKLGRAWLRPLGLSISTYDLLTIALLETTRKTKKNIHSKLAQYKCNIGQSRREQWSTSTCTLPKKNYPVIALLHGARAGSRLRLHSSLDFFAVYYTCTSSRACIAE